MHDIWNPWHGCVKISEGCQNCYMYYLDRTRDKNGADIYMTKSAFRYPLQKDRQGNFKVKSGEMLRVCMTSDFFLPQADAWRVQAWSIIRRRPDVVFYLLTKRPQRVRECLPEDWGEGWENVFFNVSCENQRRADERIPLLLELPFKHKGIMCAPLIGEVSVNKHLASGQIEQVVCGGENYDGSRPCRYEWVYKLSRECRENNVTFAFIETGTRFIKDEREYYIPKKRTQSRQAYKSGLSYIGKRSVFKLTNLFGEEIPENELYTPSFGERCLDCGSKIICNGCSNCGRCAPKKIEGLSGDKL